MVLLNLSRIDKNEVQKAMDRLQNSSQPEVDQFMAQLVRGNTGVAQRFLQGAYHYPVTWWVGIFQLQMQMGIWGYRWRSIAAQRADTLWRVSRPLRDEVSGLVRGGDTPILAAVVQYNLHYRKADVVGRFAGGQLTGYASTGGSLGARHLGYLGRGVRLLTNLTLASYGAAVKAVVTGHREVEPIVQAVLTGNPQQLPEGFRDEESLPTPEEAEVLFNLRMVLNDVIALTQWAPSPVPLNEFCSRPENINLQGVCG